jgi:hypothetical protein
LLAKPCLKTNAGTSAFAVVRESAVLRRLSSIFRPSARRKLRMTAHSGAEASSPTHCPQSQTMKFAGKALVVILRWIEVDSVLKYPLTGNVIDLKTNSRRVFEQQ